MDVMKIESVLAQFNLITGLVEFEHCLSPMEKQLSLLTYSQGSLSFFSKLEKNYWSWGNVFLSFLMAYGLLRFAVDAVRMLRWLCKRNPIELKTFDKPSSLRGPTQTTELEKVNIKDLQSRV